MKIKLIEDAAERLHERDATKTTACCCHLYVSLSTTPVSRIYSFSNYSNYSRNSRAQKAPACFWALKKYSRIKQLENVAIWNAL